MAASEWMRSNNKTYPVINLVICKHSVNHVANFVN